MAPTEKEQQEVAMFWAMEEANVPRSWDEEKELDYSQVSRKREGEQTAKTGEEECVPTHTHTHTHTPLINVQL